MAFCPSNCVVFKHSYASPSKQVNIYNNSTDFHKLASHGLKVCGQFVNWRMPQKQDPTFHPVLILPFASEA